MATKSDWKDAGRETFYGELHALLTAGLDFSRAFALLIEGESDRRAKEAMQRLYARVVGGDALWQAMRDGGGFGALDCGVVRIGEQTGRLSEALDFLRDYYCKRAAQKRMISSAVSYPLVILCTAAAVVIFMLSVIVPMFEQVYARMGGELPSLTRGIIALSKSLPGYAAAATVGAAVCGGVLYRNRRSEGVRARMSALLLRIPVAGDIVRRNYQARFCKLLYLLTSSGIPLLTGIAMLEEVITFYPYQRSFGEICRGLEQGQSFAANIARFPGLFSGKFATLIRVGEETNRLPQMLLNQGEALTKELEYRIRQMGSMLEPALILLVGILVAVILVAMYLPMFRLGGIMG